MQWTEDQVIDQAPDAASVKAGRGLANPGKWPLLGASEVALWGEAKGSGQKPYQTRIDLKQLGYKCSCPSRKFPCKHALGLFLLYARSPDIFSAGDPPEWVSSWLEQRGQRAEKKAEKASKPVDAQAQAKRAEKRMEKIGAGAAELQRWLYDTVRGGLATLPERDRQFWQNIAARMIDAQAPGLATTLRSMSDTAYYAAGWEQQAWEKLTQLYLATEGIARIEQLPPEQQEDLRAAVGLPYTQEKLQAQDGVPDTWWVLGKQEYVDERLTTVKYWLKGQQSNRFALILQFIVPNQPREIPLVAGTQLEATLVFYPGSYPLRAMIKEQGDTQPFAPLTGYADLSVLEEVRADTVAASPWAQQFPAVLSEITPELVGERLLLRDRNNKVLFTESTFDARWMLLALSGGHPLSVAGIVEFQTIHPLGAWTGANYYTLAQ